MREILFRGKCGAGWYEGDLRQYDGQTVIIPQSSVGDFDGFVVAPDSVGQYTGLRDKNGKRIFEGDIVKYECGNLLFTALIEEHIDRCGGYQMTIINSEDIKTQCFCGGDAECSTVIGNKYDSPELVGQGE